jgi:hypothetical protein
VGCPAAAGADTTSQFQVHPGWAMTKRQELPEIEEKRVACLYSRTDILKCFGEFFVDALPRVGYEEDHFWVNIRILLCIVCCSFGAYAQFGTKFPQDTFILGCCVAGYFGFSGVLAIVDYKIITTSVMCIKIGNDAAFLDVTMPAFSHEVTLALRSRSKTVSEKSSVGNYFDLDGVLRQENLFKDFTALVEKFEKETGVGKKDKKL